MYEKAVETAKKHYYFLEVENYKEWIKTLTKNLQENAIFKGSTSYFLWTTGRKYVTKYGVHYEFYKIDLNQSDEKNVKIFLEDLTLTILLENYLFP